LIVWRLTTRDTTEDAFNGLGASKYGGRWNSKGTKIVYCSDTVSLAVLENLIHFDNDVAPPLYLYEVGIDDNKVLVDSSVDSLVTNLAKAKQYGDRWVTSSNEVAFIVPSAVIERESNILLNPEHSDFGNLKITPHGFFDLDSRLTK